MSILLPLLFIVLTCLVIWRACDGFEIASEYLGRNLSEGVRGGTINAVSSSLPELLTTVIALLFVGDEQGFAIGLGTTAGSALFNGMIIPACCILAVIGSHIGGRMVHSVDVSAKVLWRDGIALVLCETAVYFLLARGVLDWWQGGVLVLLYLVYLAYMLMSMKSPATRSGEEVVNELLESDDEEDGVIGRWFYWLSFGPLLDLERVFVSNRQRHDIRSQSWNAFPLLLTATAVIGAACYVLVMACEALGRAIEMPSLFVAVIFASMATSVPDTVMSIRDARDGDYDDAVANALGSNLFNIGFALGFPLFLYTSIFGPIQMNAEVTSQTKGILLLLLILTVLGFAAFFVGPRRQTASGVRVIRLTRLNGFLLIGLYLLFMAYIIGMVARWDWAMWIASWLSD